jgi:hypothetical protein
MVQLSVAEAAEQIVVDLNAIEVALEAARAELALRSALVDEVDQLEIEAQGLRDEYALLVAEMLSSDARAAAPLDAPAGT